MGDLLEREKVSGTEEAFSRCIWLVQVQFLQSDWYKIHQFLATK